MDSLDDMQHVSQLEAKLKETWAYIKLQCNN